MKFNIKKEHLPYYVLIIFGLLCFMMGIVNHYLFKTATYDYGNYNFAFWDYSHFRISTLPTLGCNFLQDHFSLTLMYFVPIYWLLNWLTHTYTLIIIQCSLVVIAAWYSHRIIKLKSDSLWLTTGVLIYYFVLLGRFTTFSGDVNLAVISACFIPIFLYYFEVRKYKIAFIILILSLFSRENIPIWFVFIFIVLIIQNYNDKKAVLFSIAGIVISIIYFIVLFKVFIPGLETPNKQYSLFNYSALGATPGEALTFILCHPFEAIKLFFINHLPDHSYDGVKMEFYWVYILSGGLILIIRPQYIIWFIPIVAQKVLNDAPFRWGITSYYSIEVVTLLPLTVFLVITSIKTKKLQDIITVAVCIGAIGMTVNKLDTKNCRVPWIMNPPKEKFYDKRFYNKPFNIKKVNKLLSLIPSNAKVSASNMILPHLAQRQNIYFFPEVKDAEYIVLSVFDHYYLFTQYEDEKSRLNIFSDPKWEIISVEYPVFLLKFNEYSKESSLNKLWSHSDTLLCNYEKLDSAKGQITFSNGEIANNIVFLTSDMSRSCNNSIVLSSKNAFSNSIKLNDIDQVSYIQISIWCYSKVDRGYLVASDGTGFYKASFENDSIEPSGWRRLVMNFWVPQDIDISDFNIKFGSNGVEHIYFDDLQIIKSYKRQ